jgi:uncharacterized protein with gpF-like domain
MRRLVSPTGKPKTLSGIRSNLGIEAAYRKKLDGMVDEMHRSIVYWITALYRAKPPEMAQDADTKWAGMSPAMALRKAMRGLGARWQKKFDDLAPELAKHFATSVADRVDGAMMDMLKNAGFTVQFKMTASVNDVLQATIGEQVGLIKSIAAEHLSEVEGLVMRSVAAGRDMGFLAKELQHRYGITKRRAAFIAHDQSNKAMSMISRVRQTEAGITEAIWVHSGAGKHPRHSHVEQSGKKYSIVNGWYDPEAREVCWPGTLVNCRCWGKPILPGR